MRRNITLAILLLILLATSVSLYQIRSQQVVIRKDKDTGQEIVVDAPFIKGYEHPEFTVFFSSDSTLINKGMTANEYQRTVDIVSDIIISKHKERYKFGAIKGKTVQFKQDENTFTFKSRLDSNLNSTEIDVEVARIRYNIIKVSVYEVGELIGEREEKINIWL